MLKAKSFLQPQEFKDLIEHVAAHGENYDRYLNWCNEHNIPEENRYTRQYYHRWTQVPKNKSLIRAAKAEHALAVRREMTLTKDMRVAELQASASRIREEIGRQLDTHECEVCECHNSKSVDTMIKLEEQLRKTLESISKEMGEFNKAAEERVEVQPLKTEMAVLLRGLQKKRPVLIEARPVGED